MVLGLRMWMLWRWLLLLWSWRFDVAETCTGSFCPECACLLDVSVLLGPSPRYVYRLCLSSVYIVRERVGSNCRFWLLFSSMPLPVLSYTVQGGLLSFAQGYLGNKLQDTATWPKVSSEIMPKLWAAEIRNRYRVPKRGSVTIFLQARGLLQR